MGQQRNFRLWTALGIVYVVWGSTYLAIRFAVDGGLPPLLSAGVRHALAAVLLAAFIAVRRGVGAFRASPRQWLTGGAIGLLLLLGGNGGVMLAEDHHLPSGLAALMVAGVPLFVVALRWFARDLPSARTLLGVLVGFGGLAVLLLPGSRPEGGTHWQVRIVSEAFRGKPPVARHRMVYEALGDLMDRDIHALRIEAFAPEQV